MVQVVEPLSSDRNGQIKRIISPSSLLYSSSSKDPLHRRPHSVASLKNIFSETLPSRVALFSSSSCCVFKAPWCLNSPNAESDLSLAVNAIGKTRAARSVTWILQSAIPLSSLSYLRICFKMLTQYTFVGFPHPNNAFLCRQTNWKI